MSPMIRQAPAAPYQSVAFPASIAFWKTRFADASALVLGVAFCPVTFVNLPDDFDEILGPRSVLARLDCDE